MGHAIEAFPTPEAIAILRNVLRNIRHAGIEKKLKRNLSGAERELAGRMEVALRLPPDQPASKTQITTLARGLQASLGSAIVLSHENWRARLAEHPQARGLAGSLVWRVLDPEDGGVAVLPVTKGGRLELQNSSGKAVVPGSGCCVTLWHPLDATAEERSAWRDRLAALQIKQPFKQVFREHYVVADCELAQGETAMFSGLAVSVRPLLGLARREGWSIDDDRGLTRALGQRMVRLDLADQVFPGAAGWTTTGTVSIWTIGGRKWRPGRLGDLSAVAVSEVLRSVDLLVSVSGFAIAPTAEDDSEGPLRRMHLRRPAENPLGPMAEMRRHALERVLAGRDGMAELTFDSRHLRLGRYAIHLATGRVTRDGEPIAIGTPTLSNKASMPWLPYDEKLLETIACTALELARRGKT